MPIWHKISKKKKKKKKNDEYKFEDRYHIEYRTS